MSFSKFFDDAKGNCSDEIGDRSDVQNQEMVNDQISDPNQSVVFVHKIMCPLLLVIIVSVRQFKISLSRLELLNWNADAANTSPLGTPASGTMPIPSLNNQLQMSVEQESALIIVQNANTFLAEENHDLKIQCARMKRALKRQKRILDREMERGIGLAERAANLYQILLMGSDAQLRERNTELEASNAQLRERNTELEAINAQLRERKSQLENGSNERVVDKENDNEQGQARS
ncbi:hypothetical protein SADUNF_Sadunf01G0056000 [Salix dunnii]|uniref:Uncharacterized protein n=1 Tax=Salix dunnii TaxID=1413687 RepID=A0A835NA84_9ROSI|nr:hypothetical protein SADUNF_Sadunf01G0056000 [Salix dunnii]